MKSFVAVFVGFAAVAALSLGVDMLLHLTGVFPVWGKVMSDSMFGLATAYRTAFAIWGSYLAARLAPNRPMAHALWLGGVGSIVATAGAAATWSAGPEFGPRWYPVALVVTALPCAWLGGKLFLARAGK